MSMITNDWLDEIQGEFKKPYYRELYQFVRDEYSKTVIYPPADDIFNAMHFTPLSKVKVLLLGQDPYHNVNQAHGLSFSVLPGNDIPPSLQNIYKELNKESKNFSPGLIEENSRTRNYATSIQWLTLAHIVNQSFQLKEHITMPLIQDNESNFRLFLGDIGMFSYQSGINAASFISNERENTLSGIFFENFVANELVAKEHHLFYWRGRTSCELEFIVESNNKLYPIDVKKGRGTLNSLKKFSNHNKFEFAIKVSKNNYGYNPDQKLLTVPFYFMPFIAKDLADGTITI